MPLSSQTYWNVIKKARGNRPDESLATLWKEEGATFYPDNMGKDNNKNSPSVLLVFFLIFPDTNQKILKDLKIGK